MTRADILRKMAELSEEITRGKHPSVPTAALANGRFPLGELNMDEFGNVVLTRVAYDETHLTKRGISSAGVGYLIATSLCFGGGNGLPTSGLIDWESRYGSGFVRDEAVIGIYRIPHEELFKLIGQGKAVIGNVVEGEVVLCPQEASRFLSETKKISPPRCAL